MQHGVDLDAAWGAYTPAGEGRGSNDRYQLPSQESSQPLPGPSLQRPTRSPLQQSPEPITARQSTSTRPRSKAPANAAHNTSIEAVTELSRELCDLRRQLQAQASSTSIVMYAGIVVGVLMLIVIAQTQAKLHHATEALLWTMHR